MDYKGFHNGRPCKACTSAEEMLQIGKRYALKKADQNPQSQKQETPTTSSSQGNVGAEQNGRKSSEASEKESAEPRPRRSDCPVDKDELGRSTWNLLHTMSVYYPDKPTDTERNDMKETLSYLSKTYPCPPCAEDFRKDLKVNPPRLEDRNSFASWMCEMHNRVNTKLGKDTFDCNRVMERWYDGWKDGSCDYYDY